MSTTIQIEASKEVSITRFAGPSGDDRFRMQLNVGTEYAVLNRIQALELAVEILELMRPHDKTYVASGE